MSVVFLSGAGVGVQLGVEGSPELVLPGVVESGGAEYGLGSEASAGSYCVQGGVVVVVKLENVSELVCKLVDGGSVKADAVLRISVGRGGRGGDVEIGASGLVGEGDKASGHELDHVDAKMFVLHGANADRGVGEVGKDGAVRGVDDQLDMRGEVELGSERTE